MPENGTTTMTDNPREVLAIAANSGNVALAIGAAGMYIGDQIGSLGNFLGEVLDPTINNGLVAIDDTLEDQRAKLIAMLRHELQQVAKAVEALKP